MAKFRNYALSVAEAAKQQSRRNIAAFRVGGVSGVCAGIMMNPAMSALAAEEVSGGTNLLDAETLAVITNGFSSIVITLTAVVVMAMTASLTVMGLSQACDYALKRMKSAFKKAQ